MHSVLLFRYCHHMTMPFETILDTISASSLFLSDVLLVSHFSLYTPTRPRLVLERPTVTDVTRKRATRLLRLAATTVFTTKILLFYWSCLVMWLLASGSGGIFKTSTSVFNIYWPVWVFTHRAMPRDSRSLGGLKACPITSISPPYFQLPSVQQI